MLIFLCRKRKKRGHSTIPPNLCNGDGISKSAERQAGQPYITVDDLPLPESNGTDNPAYSTVVSETALSAPVQSRDTSAPTSVANKDGGTYDISELYSVVNKSKKITTAGNVEFENLYSNNKIPAEKGEQRNKAKTSTSENPTERNLDTGIQLGAPGSGNLSFEGDYDTPYDTLYDTPRDTKVKTNQPGQLILNEYDQVKLSRV